ncbi:MAG: hypothetical protein ABWX63_03705 [Paeniglutamicibacter terrestris]|jgi:uncharacterized membrane protein|uniref:DUF2273 domain-containing protein n=1 Tax=Paeniglutamicibacter terrestris TaxID=2723403 RepID=A0ABX1G6U8_9MICC|nr:MULTISPECIES: hypothetical protein [Paeniglutamicibacter]ASN40758.1 hypothetical protein CGQ24_18320 [Arthrobacter sp. 7749]NKG21260.1 hypothetical protein [Paeniglutamicibacter terrestris]QXQ10520.1 hypothetical protein KUF55_00740 [Paeniglutamicibacter sp. Y32M11]
MKPTLIGALLGAILAWAALSYGVGGFLLMALFMALGALLSRIAGGRVDFRAVLDALTGRRSSS